MLGVLSGFFVVWSIILVGMFVGSAGSAGRERPFRPQRLTFFVASPALLFETLSKAKLHDVFAAPLLVTAVGAVVTAALFFVIVRFLLKRTVPESLMSSMSASLANSANLGIPIAVYVLGDASYVAPLLIFQLAFFTPTVPDGPRRHHQRAPDHPRCASSLMIVKNPMIVGSALGLVVAGTGWQVPRTWSWSPIHLIGGAAIPGHADGVRHEPERIAAAADGRGPPH